MESPEVLVIGAGAAGIMAAWRAAKLGRRTLILEKTPRLGTKILVSGGGKCNIAHDGPLEDVLRSFRPNEARFIRPSCYRWTNQDAIGFFTSRGLEVYTRPNGRVFPVHQTAKDVVAILRRELDDAGVEIQLETPVRELICSNGKIEGVRTDSGDVRCERVVLAVGGSSYPNSGTTGDGWPWAKALGHRIVRVHAALAPIYLTLDQEWISELSGVALRDVILKARLNGKEIDRWRDDVLFTHQGISGPCALGISRVVSERSGEGEITLEIDLRPEASPEEVARWAAEYVSAHPKRKAGSLLDGIVPESVVRWVFEAATADPHATIAQFDRKSRNRLVEQMKGWRLGAVRTVPLEKGEVVAGGVSLDEVDPQTMRSKLVEGLYLCGEALDIAGPVGGYNLQAAWSTGYVAGETAAQDAIARRS